MTSWLRRLFPDPAERQRRHRLAAVVEDVVSHTEPRLRAARRYRRRLEGPVEKSMLYGEALAWAVPGPIDFDAATWAADPLVHAFFSSVPAMRQSFSRSRELRAFFDSHPQATSCYCLLFAERQLKTVFTTRQLDDGIPQEMATTSVTFAEPTPCLPTADEGDLRGQLGILVFNGVTRAAVALLAKRKKDRKAVEEQQALLTLRMKLARDAGKCLDSLMAGAHQAEQVDAALQRDVAEVERRAAALPGRMTELEHAFQEVVAVYDNPEAHVYVHGIDICLDRMNLVAPECRYDGAKVRLLEATGPRGTRVALVARYARADILPAQQVFLDAEKALA
jgi:hypothetical protein